jgi:hypothetical protein
MTFDRESIIKKMYWYLYLYFAKFKITSEPSSGRTISRIDPPAKTSTTTMKILHLVLVLLLVATSIGSEAFQLAPPDALSSTTNREQRTCRRRVTLCLSTHMQPESDCVAMTTTADDTTTCTHRHCVALLEPTATAAATATFMERSNGDCHHNHDETTATCTRRAALFGWSSFLFALVATATTTATTTLYPPLLQPAHVAIILGGVATTTMQSSARVASWPGIETLEPLYELKLSIDSIVASVADSKNWPFIQTRLERFFQGFIVNEKNFYLGVAFQYSNDIQYAREELPSYVLMDKEARYDAIDLTMKRLENLKKSLATRDDALITADAKAAQAALDSWFALVPPKDFQAVQELFVHVKKADTNRDGRLSDNELIFLSPTEQQVWKLRVEKFG